MDGSINCSPFPTQFLRYSVVNDKSKKKMKNSALSAILLFTDCHHGPEPQACDWKHDGCGSNFHFGQ